MHTAIKAEIIALAQATPTVEVCGFIWHRRSDGEPHVMSCRNVAANPATDFQISDEDHIRAIRSGPILGVYHSHPNTPGFSPADMECAEVMGVPFFVHCVANRGWIDYIPHTYDPPLAGRPWVFGFEDCYELIRIYFRKQGHYMSDYDRDTTANLRDLILARFEMEGFQRVGLEEARIGDVLMFQSSRTLSNHFGVLIGPSRMLHHHIGALSCEETVTDRWLARLDGVFRLKA